jgi:hypothetical protein
LTDYGVDVLAFGPHPDDVIGVSHGEPLRSPGVPGLVDPVRQFRDNPFPEAHAFEPLS